MSLIIVSSSANVHPSFDTLATTIVMDVQDKNQVFKGFKDSSLNDGNAYILFIEQGYEFCGDLQLKDEGIIVPIHNDSFISYEPMILRLDKDWKWEGMWKCEGSIVSLSNCHIVSTIPIDQNHDGLRYLSSIIESQLDIKSLLDQEIVDTDSRNRIMHCGEVCAGKSAHITSIQLFSRALSAPISTIDPIYTFPLMKYRWYYISLWYMGQKKDSSLIHRWLLFCKIPNDKTILINDIQFYCYYLKCHKIPISTKHNKDIVKWGNGVHCPSIVKLNNGNVVSVTRINNYTIEDGNYVFHGSNHVQSRNVLCQWGNKVTEITWEEGTGREKYLEDIRLFSDGNKVFFLTTVMEYPPLIGMGEIDINNSKIIGLKKLARGCEGRCEKNWLPFWHEGEYYSIYSYDPLVIHRLDVESRTYSLHLVNPSPLDLRSARGSGPPKRWKDGWLVLIHLTICSKPRIYTHSFLFYDLEWNLISISDIFKLSEKKIEFSLYFDIIGDQVQLYYCEQDEESFLALCDVGYDVDPEIGIHMNPISQILSVPMI